MEIYERAQMFVGKDDDLQFDHTKFIVKGQDDQYFHATTKDRINDTTPVDLDQLELVPIPVENIWPPFSDNFSQAPELSPTKHYIKEPSLLIYGISPKDGTLIRNQILSEIAICELLKANPHPNIGVYTGCVVTNGRVRGLCLVRYKMTLNEKLRGTEAFDKETCLREIEMGIRHLHSLDLAHNDINPHNIMFDDSDRAVIIDFDSCCRPGQKLVKGGTKDWFQEEEEYSRFENDLFGLSKLREHMLEGTWEFFTEMNSKARSYTQLVWFQHDS